MRETRTGGALLCTIALLLAACGSGADDRDGLVQDRLRAGNTQVEAECYADAVIAEFGGDPASDGELEDGDVSILLSIVADCVG